MGSIPAKWLDEFGWSAEFNLALLEQVEAASVDPNDMEKVRPIAKALKGERQTK